MKQLLTGMLIMFLMTCYLMGNVGHFPPLPQFLLLPDYVIINHSKEHYLWTNVALWSSSYAAMYWTMYQMSQFKRHTFAPSLGCAAILIGFPIVNEYYTDHGYYLPILVLLIIWVLSGWQALRQASNEFDMKRKIRTKAQVVED